METEIIVIIIIGAVAGWLGSLIYRGSGLGLLGNIVVGVIGSFVGYWLLGKLGIDLGTGWIGAILTGAVGAIVILLLFNLIARKR
ncbi:MAG: GlsB/YeaQ/YmgE family stress response membrane protein [Bacteroidales bacterium]|nr:GlsB/YeaQ/YmgE family stress response membrane protein [Bacteroidales bacterium]